MVSHHRGPEALAYPFALPRRGDRIEVPIGARIGPALDYEEAHEVTGDGGLQDLMPQIGEAVLHPDSVAPMARFAIEPPVKNIPTRRERALSDPFDGGEIFRLGLGDAQVLVDTRGRRD